VLIRAPEGAASPGWVSSDLAWQAAGAEVSPVAAAAAGGSLRGFSSDVQRRLPPRPEPPGYSWCARALQLLLIVSPILLSYPSPLPSQARTRLGAP